VDRNSQLFEPKRALHSLWSGLQVLQAGKGPCSLAQGRWIKSDNCSFLFKINYFWAYVLYGPREGLGPGYWELLPVSGEIRLCSWIFRAGSCFIFSKSNVAFLLAHMFNHPLHTQITLYQVPKKSTKQLNLLLSRCTMLDSITMVGIEDLSRLLSMVAKRKKRNCHLRHLAIHGLYNRPENFTEQVVSILTKQVLIWSYEAVR